jgi:type IV secretory pathway VirB3-like protein
MGNLDFDAAMQAASQVAWGPGMRVLVTLIAGYLFFWGLAHERLWACACGVLGAIGYWGMGVFLGKVGIALNTVQPHAHAFALVLPRLAPAMAIFGIGMTKGEETDDAIADRLLLPPCRPELMWGIPYKAFLFLVGIWMMGVTLFGAVITGTGVCVMIWWALRALTAWDFNAISVMITYGRTKLIAVRSPIWITGITLDPLFGQR